VQHHGSGADGLDEAFEAAGADVVSLTIYRWGPPPDIAVVRRSVIAASTGEYDAILFTSAPGAQEWLGSAEILQVLPAMRAQADAGRLLMAAVGPITAGPLRAAGFEPLIPDRGRLGSLVRAVVTYFGGGHAPGIETTSGRLELRSAGIVLDGRHIPLSRPASTSSPRSRTQAAAPYRGRSCRARFPVPWRTRTPSRSRSPVSVRRSACPI